MSTELNEVEKAAFALPTVVNPYSDDFSAFASEMFLPRLQLEGSSSKLVKNRKMTAGCYALMTGRDQFEDLGEEVDFLLLTYRSKALDISDKKNIISVFDK